MEFIEGTIICELTVLYISNNKENNFQAVIITNGLQSYTVFTYQCGELNWVGLNSASIGFCASSTSFANHLYSQQQNVNDIACLNQSHPPWTNVVYQISRELGDILWIYICIQTCEYAHKTLTINLSLR